MSLSFANFLPHELTFLRGIEKEGLRTSNGMLAMTEHPENFGSALTNKFITMDYSECLLEMITPPFKEVEELTNFLENLHIFINNGLADNQILWSASMPCILNQDRDIPIANFGKSNIGKMKHIYRRGLGCRYSRKMQSIAGIHYNFSFSQQFWQKYGKLKNLTQDLTKIKNNGYFFLIRNIHRYSDLLIYLFGCSPLADSSFLKESENKCLTSIRMSKFGYTSDKQKQIKIYYDNLEEYNNTLVKFMNKKDDDYQSIGIKKNGQYHQLNDNILQIENEFYSIVRPKQNGGDKQTPSQRLKQKGVDYIELRLLDLNIFSPIGISKEQIYFLDLFLLFCLSSSSPLIDKNELELIEENRQRVINSGCQEHFMHINKDKKLICFKEWGKNILAELAIIAKDLDHVLQKNHYTNAVNLYSNQLQSGNNFAEQFKKEMKTKNLSFIEFTEQKSKQYKSFFINSKKDSKIQELLQKEVSLSIKQQLKIEENQHQSFDQFLKQYYQETQLCKITS